MNKSVSLVGMWEKAAKNGRPFYVSNNITFGELRNMLKELKDAHDIIDSDVVNFFLFSVESDNENAPRFHLNINKNNYKK